MSNFNAFLDYMRKKGYKVKIAFKDESFLMKLLGFLLFFTKDFMTRFTTTLGNTVYFPSRKWLKKHERAAIRVLAHELVYIQDRKKMDKKYTVIAYPFIYLFPQILAVFSLLAFLAFINLNWLFCLLFLLFLAPFPAPGRFYIEARGYTMNLLIGMYLQKTPDQRKTEAYAKKLAKYFTGPLYYYMWPFHDHVVKTLLRNYFTAMSPVFWDVYSWFQREKVEKA